jgi:protein FAM50
MSGASTPNPRFVAQNTTAEDQLKSQTVGLVALSDFRKRRAEVLEQSQRDRTLGPGTSSGAATPSGTSTPRDG